MTETTYKFYRESVLEDLESAVLNIESVPQLVPRLGRIGTSKVRKEHDTKDVAVVGVGFRHFHQDS
jgi:hypothetical protein